MHNIRNASAQNSAVSEFAHLGVGQMLVLINGRSEPLWSVFFVESMIECYRKRSARQSCECGI